MTAIEVFKQNVGDVTKAYYAEMNRKGIEGGLAVALFRAQKRSTAAKTYRGGGHRSAAYEVKNWSLSEICRICSLMDRGTEVAATSGRWGWQRDPNTPNFEWVLYVELDTGQCSFHSATRLAGPEFTGRWKPHPDSTTSILAYCDAVSFHSRDEK